MHVRGRQRAGRHALRFLTATAVGVAGVILLFRATGTQAPPTAAPLPPDEAAPPLAVQAIVEGTDAPKPAGRDEAVPARTRPGTEARDTEERGNAQPAAAREPAGAVEPPAPAGVSSPAAEPEAATAPKPAPPPPSEPPAAAEPPPAETPAPDAGEPPPSEQPPGDGV